MKEENEKQIFEASLKEEKAKIEVYRQKVMDESQMRNDNAVLHERVKELESDITALSKQVKINYGCDLERDSLLFQYLIYASFFITSYFIISAVSPRINI